MERVDRCRRRAEEAERLAEKATTLLEAESYRKIARAWRDLQMKAEASLGISEPPQANRRSA